MFQYTMFLTAAWAINIASVVMVTASASARITATSSVSPFLRGHHHYSPRNLAPHPNSGHQSTYKGCLAYSESELSQSWSFSGELQSCSWLHTDYYDNDNSASQSGGGGGGGSSSSSSSSNNGGNNGSDGSDSSVYGDDDANSSRSTGGGSSNGEGSDDGGYDGSDSNYDEVVITNEDVYNGYYDYDPIDDFDIEVCDTYNYLWLWDLSLSCETMDGDTSLGSCNCTFAEELRDYGLLTCDDASYCPSDCPICFTCMQILGCDVRPPNQPLASQWVSTSIMLYIIAAAVAIFVLALTVYYSHRKWQDQNDLGKYLIEKQKSGGGIGIDQDGPSFMYIDGDLMWKPLPSDRQYAAQFAAQTIQPTSTTSMSTVSVSTGKEFVHERVQPRRMIILPSILVNTSDDSENGLVSPLQTREDSDSSMEEKDTIEDNLSNNLP